MNKAYSGKTLKKYVFTAIIFALALAVMFLGALSSKRVWAATADYSPTSLNISNGSFSSSSGSAPSSPSNWTLTVPDGSQKGSAKTGVLNLLTYNSSRDTIENSKLDVYDEYKNDAPKSPFYNTGVGGELDGDKNVLMINTNSGKDKDGSVITYKSDAVTLSANGYYRISAWVKTGSFTLGGASIRINGISEQNIAFRDINTVKSLPVTAAGVPDLASDPEGQLGWRKYNFYIATSPLASESVTVSLGVGDFYDYTDTEEDITYPRSSPAKGYAFFDKVEGYALSATSFYNEATNDSYNKYIDLSLESAFAAGEQENNFSFNALNKLANWSSLAPNGTDAGNAFWDVITSGSQATEFKNYGLSENPGTSTGRNSSGSLLDGALVVTTYNKELSLGESAKTFNKAAVGKKSADLKIDRFGYYRLGVFVKTENIEGGSGASLIVETDIEKSYDKNTGKTTYESFSITNATGESGVTARNGWKEYAFYIKGSAVKQHLINLQLWLGQENSLSGGVAMFHNIRFDKITYKQFTDFSANGTIVSFEKDPDDTGITNGLFQTAGNYKTYEFPMVPASWDKLQANEDPAHVFADYDDLVSGIVPVDREHFDLSREEYYNGLAYQDAFIDLTTPNVLMISNKKDTIAGYASSSFSLPADSAKKVTVWLYTNSIDGYGANLVLKANGKVIATIEKITKTYSATNIRGFQPYTFYVESGSADQSLSIEIWLGLNDRNNGVSKISSGDIFVSQAAFGDLADGETFADKKASYDAQRSMSFGPKHINYAVYSFKGEDFSAYDYYDEGFIKTPYNWTHSSRLGQDVSNAVYGIFDSTNLPANASNIAGYDSIHSGFENENSVNRGVLLLHHPSPMASTLTNSMQYTLSAGTYYKLTVNAKVILPDGNPENSVGMEIALTGTDFVFKNVRDTSKTTGSITDYETFRPFEFYIKTGDADLTTSVAVSLGGGEITDEACAGRVYVNNIEFTQIEDTVYDDIYEKFYASASSSNALDSDAKRFIKVGKISVAETPGEETGGGSGGFNWWLIPSILFSVALLIALGGIVLRRLSDKRNKRQRVYQKVTDYDRSQTLNRIHNENVGEKTGEKVKASYIDKQYEEFDDVLPPAPSKLKSKAPEKSYVTDYAQFDDSISPAKAPVDTVVPETAAVAETQTDASAEAAATTEEKPVKKAEVKAAAEQPREYKDEFDD